mgnify:FL=1
MRDEAETMSLAPGEVRVVSGIMGYELQCLEGCVWMTQYGDDRDVVLEAGRCFSPNLSSVVTLSSSRGARVVLRRRQNVGVRERGMLAWFARLFSLRGGTAVMRQLEGRLPSARVVGGDRA